MKRLAILSALFLISVTTMADSIYVQKPSFLDRVYEIVKDFSSIDKNYIEPQHYNYTVMLQNTNTYEAYTLSNKDGQQVVLAPEPSIKIGPYVGWRWVFLGYTIDVSHLFDGNHKQDLDLSIYSNQIGIDLFYRKTGDDYKIRRMNLGEGVDASSIRDIPFDGFKASIKGFNLYYILNHKRFSYPAAFNQSTCQKVSCGSPLLGIGYTQHSLTLDVPRLTEVITPYLKPTEATPSSTTVPTDISTAKVSYVDFSFTGGYAYNWVFAKNWLAAASLSVGVAHKRSTAETEHDHFRLRDFSFRNFNVDGLGRFGMVWNNTRWYYGWSVILHSYNYRKSQFSTNSVFGNANLYVGYNFGNRHSKKKRMQRGGE